MDLRINIYIIFQICFVSSLLCGVFTCNSFNEVKVEVLSRKGDTLDTTIHGCIERKSFDTTITAVRVIIKNQDVPNLKVGAVQNMVALNYVEFNNCSTKKVLPRAFRNVPQLQEIVIRNSLLEGIPKGVFDSLPSLRTIKIPNNKISEIENEAISNMPTLKSVFASNNKLKEWNGNWFVNTQEVKNIDFRHNIIEKIPKHAFRNLPNLKILLFDNNKITEIESDAFYGLDELDTLGLTNNQITFFPSDLFHNKIIINKFLISGNKLNYIPNYVMRNITVNETALDLNPWTCNCFDKILYWIGWKKITYIPFHSCGDVGLPICISTKSRGCVEVVDSSATDLYYNQTKIAFEAIDSQELKNCFKLE